MCSCGLRIADTYADSGSDIYSAYGGSQAYRCAADSNAVSNLHPVANLHECAHGDCHSHSANGNAGATFRNSTANPSAIAGSDFGISCRHGRLVLNQFYWWWIGCYAYGEW